MGYFLARRPGGYHEQDGRRIEGRAEGDEGRENMLFWKKTAKDDQIQNKGKECEGYDFHALDAVEQVISDDLKEQDETLDGIETGPCQANQFFKREEILFHSL